MQNLSSLGGYTHTVILDEEEKMESHGVRNEEDEQKQSVNRNHSHDLKGLRWIVIKTMLSADFDLDVYYVNRDG